MIELSQEIKSKISITIIDEDTGKEVFSIKNRPVAVFEMHEGEVGGLTVTSIEMVLATEEEE